MEPFLTSFVNKKSLQIDEIEKKIDGLKTVFNEDKVLFTSFQKEYEMLSKEKQEELKNTAASLRQIYAKIDQYHEIVKRLENEHLQD